MIVFLNWDFLQNTVKVENAKISTCMEWIMNCFHAQSGKLKCAGTVFQVQIIIILSLPDQLKR